MRRLLAPLLLGLAACAPAPPAQPDIVLVVVDALRADHLGVYGYDQPTSPAIDALAARGAWFSRAGSAAGWTLPSVATLLSGVYPHRHGVVRDAEDPTRLGELAPDTVTLAEALSAAGYATAAFVNNPFLRPESKLNQGFDVYDYAADPQHPRDASATVASGLNWLDQQEKPAFLLLHFMDPHLPYDPPADLRGTFSPAQAAPVPVPFLGAGLSRAGPPPDAPVREAITGLYDEEILGTDRAVGALAAGLEARRAWPRTLVVFTADHGEELWDHGGFEHGHSLYGELVRVPLILAGRGAPTGRFDTVVEQVDLFQGLLGQAGAARPPDSVGEDLWALLAPPPAEDRLALSESVVHGGPLAAITDGHLRLVVHLDTRMMELWRVAPDGSEPEQVPEAEQREAGRPLFRALFNRRGGMERITANLGSEGLSPEVEAMLKSLDYLEE